MAVFKCKMCGGSLEISEGTTVCECEYCGTKQTLPKINDEQKINMFNRASHFRQQYEFDKAAEIYEKMAAESGSDAELFWSIVLCRYGIEYVDDPVTKNKIPTCHRTQYKSILEDPDYLTALSCADTMQRDIYEREAKVINDIQKKILNISYREEPFDVFICYKETDANGRRTVDSVLAQDLYYGLTQEGFKVFFSRITLESKLGTEYEPYIFAALNSAKVMVVVGTKPEYFNAVWVRNEWSRYLQIMQKDKNRILIPAYRDMDPYDLPNELSLFQSQDMSKIGFLQDLIRGIKKITGHDNAAPVIQEKQVIREEVSVQDESPSEKDESEKKDSSVLALIIGSICIIGLGIVIACVLLFNRGEDNSSSGKLSYDSASDNYSTQALPLNSESRTTLAESSDSENSVTISDEENTVKVTEKTETTSSGNLYSTDDLKKAAAKAMEKFDKLGTDDDFIPGSLNYTLDYDLNGDGVPELIDSYAPLTESAFEIYYYNGSSFVEAYKGCGYLRICPDRHYFSVTIYGGGTLNSYFEYNDSNRAVSIDKLGKNADGYFRNDLPVSETMFNDAESQYSNLKWISIKYNDSFSTNISSGNNAGTVYTSENLEMYSEGFTAYVRTNGDVLNMRKGPGTSYEIIAEIPNGTAINVYGIENGWYYIYYNYKYGFVSKDWVS